MSYWFSKCVDAISHSIDTHTFGVYYSEVRNQDLNIHVHDCCEVLLCLSGGSNFLIDGRAYETSNGDLFILNQFEPHKISASPDSVFARFVLQIHPEYLIANSTEDTDLTRCFYTRGDGISNKISLNDKELAEIEQLFIQFRTDRGFGDDILKKSAVNSLLVLINQLFMKHSITDNALSVDDEIMLNTINYINAHFSEELTLEILAKRAYISVNQLCKLFKKRFGTTVAKYIVSKRISEAKKLLSQGGTVSETALACGFSDYANFIRVFKKFVGVSPGKYNKI
ncbi:MAG: helix-turn-helix transcriptional regulator [Clostridia bacterium]|nr:helix-turn-helix transcriptional regulator [Clostridia bacterium]